SPPVGGGGPLVGPYVAATQANITGTVTNSVTTAGISGATITVTCTAPAGCTPPPSATTSATGGYTTANINWGGSGAASGQVTASASGYTSQTKPWTAKGGNNATVNFALSPAVGPLYHFLLAAPENSTAGN